MVTTRPALLEVGGRVLPPHTSRPCSADDNSEWKDNGLRAGARSSCGVTRPPSLNVRHRLGVILAGHSQRERAWIPSEARGRVEGERAREMRPNFHAGEIEADRRVVTPSIRWRGTQGGSW